MGKDKESYEKNLQKFEKISRELDEERRSRKKKKKKDRKRSPSPEREAEVRPKKSKKEKRKSKSPEPQPEPVEEQPQEPVREKKKKKKNKKEKEDEDKPVEEEKPMEPVRITADDVASMAKEAEKEELKQDICNMGQYTGAKLEGGEARLNKFARLLGGRKKDSKGLFAAKKVESQRRAHENVVNGEALNNRLEVCLSFQRRGFDLYRKFRSNSTVHDRSTMATDKAVTDTGGIVPSNNETIILKPAKNPSGAVLTDFYFTNFKHK